MGKTLAFATLFSTALLGSVVFAQSASPRTIRRCKTRPNPPRAPMRILMQSSINFVTMQEKAQWRTPKLIGVDIYGADNKKIGKIDDILMGHDGKAEAVVIGVGGFLGIGKKDVGVPFSAIEWKTEPRKVPATDLPPTNPVAPNTTGQTAVPPPMKETDPAATEADKVTPIGRSSMRPRRNSRQPLTFTMRQIPSPSMLPEAAGTLKRQPHDWPSL